MVVAVGEAHAQKGTEHVRTAARRFTEELLPALAPRATDLVLELIVADGRCGRKVEREVAERQQPVTESQSQDNQDDYVKLAARAKELGITPHVLRPTCEEYQEILKAGDDAVIVMLEMIARLTTRQVRALLAKNAREDVDGLIIAYGGALHNDVEPRSERASFSYAAALMEASAQRYVELDVFVPEHIRDTDVWRNLDWYEHYRREWSSHAVLFVPRPSSFVLVLNSEQSLTRTEER
jgi:NADH:ubiquinone oxidoreductase subunit C